MHTRILRLIFPLLSASLSGVLLALAFPKYDQGWLGWCALVPLFISILNRKCLPAFLLALIFGVVFFTGVFSWIFDIPGYNFIHHVLLGFYFGPLMGLFGLIISAVSRRWKSTAALLAMPFIWVSIEYLRSNLSFLALPWALLGHSQYQSPALIQIASFTGAYGISFLMAFTNAALAAIILSTLSMFERYRLTGGFLPSRLSAFIMLLAAAAGTGLTFLYGYMTISQPINGPEIKISVLQGNIDQEMKADPKKHTTFIMEKYTDLTRRALKDKPELIVWPEAATPGFVLKNMLLHKHITSLIKETKTHFIIGSSEYPKFVKPASSSSKGIGNTALFFSPQGKVVGQYLKIHLVPFGEYIPYEGTIPWPDFVIPEGKRSYEIPGNEFTVFGIDGTKFGVLICWEIVFPDLFRQFVKRGANFMINITNEGWFGETAAPYQMVMVNVFRAVENRIAVARAANTGISCYIDPHGRIAGRVINNNKDIYVEGYLTRKVPLTYEKTFYTIYGDIFVYIILSFAVFMIALTFLKSKKGSSGL